jgi:hypothetical protein
MTMRLKPAPNASIGSSVTLIDLQPLLGIDPLAGLESAIDEIDAAMSSGRAVPLSDLFDPTLRDGWVSFVADGADAESARVLIPLAAEFDLPLTLFVRTCSVESGTWIDHTREPMSWEALAEAHEVGIELGTSGHGLDPWRSCETARVAAERSAVLFENRLGLELSAVRCRDASVSVQRSISDFAPIIVA